MAIKKKPMYIAYSDIHHNQWNQFNDENRRIMISMGVEHLIFQKAQKLNIPVLFTGDIIHTEMSVSNTLLSYILPHYKKMESYDTQMIAISGNHDQCETNTEEHRSPTYIETFSRVFPYIDCIDFKTYVFDNNKTIITGVPYLTHDLGLLGFLKKEVKKRKSNKAKYKGYKKILMIHTTLPKTRDTDGRLIQTNTIGHEEMDFMEKHFDLILTGHIHKPMKLSDKIIQVGATNQQRKTDKDCKLGYWIIYDNLEAEFVSVKSPKFIELEPGEKKPDKDNFYYPRVIDKKIETVKFLEENNDFKDVNNKRKIAKAYLKEVGIKDVGKKHVLINALKDSD